jgi:hypothetical protein
MMSLTLVKTCSAGVNYTLLVMVTRRLNMELDLQSLFRLRVHSCPHWLRLHSPPPPIPPHLGSYTRALLVSQDRRHLFVTPLWSPKVSGLSETF